MKRMNEVFELPIDRSYLIATVKNSSKYEDELIINAINNCDSLADALANLMAMLGGAPKECGHEFHCVCPYEKAAAALKAYRGEK